MLVKEIKMSIIKYARRRQAVGNTKERGILRFMIFKAAGEKEFTGVCYELSIVLQDKNPEVLSKELLNAAQGYVMTVIKKKMSDKLLNQSDKLPKEYAALFEDFAKLYDVHHKPSLSDLVEKVIIERAFVETVPVA
jgi:hypothetical protein